MKYIDKADRDLGWKVHEHLVKLGLETPMTESVKTRTDEQKIEDIQPFVRQILNVLGMDLTDDSLCETPKRVAKMYVKDLFWGLDYNKFPKCTTVENKMAAPDEFVLVKDITAHSTCEHHMVIIDGLVSVAYIPSKKVLGISKLARVVSFFLARLSVQERSTHQICEALKFILETDDVCVYMNAVHYCMKARGIQDSSASTVTMATSGKFAGNNSILRGEFLRNITFK